MFLPAIEAKPITVCDESAEIKRFKGIWWIPWRIEAMKDVACCEKLRGVASKL